MRTRLRRFLSRRPAEQWLLLRTWVFLLAVRAGLVLLPFARVHGFFQRRNARRSEPTVQDFTREELAWAVRSAGRAIPSSKPCLTQALVLDSYLKRRGYPSRIALGVARGAGRTIEAHAWIESEGVVVLGGEDLGRFTELRSVEPGAAAAPELSGRVEPRAPNGPQGPTSSP